MSTELTTIQTALSKRGIDEALWSAIGSSIFPGASEESKLLAFDYCQARGLDIMKKPCHIVPMNVKDAKTGKYEWRDVIMPGIAEARITAHRTKAYAGQDAPIFGPAVQLEFGRDTHTVPEFCTVTVYRMIEGKPVGTSHTEYFEEAAGTTKDGSLNSMWSKRKRGQLAKCAEAGALRKAFPEEMGGIITAEEAGEDAGMRDATPRNKRLTVRETALDPRAEPTSEEPQQDQPIAPNESVTPAQGKQKKDRHHRECLFQEVVAKATAAGKTFWVAFFHIGKKTVEMVTWSETLANGLLSLDENTSVKVTFTVGAKGGYDLEDYVVREEKGGRDE